MDFHNVLEESLFRFSGLQGIVFVDPDGEAIVFKVNNLGDYEVRLAGANLSILTRSLDIAHDSTHPRVVELQCDDHCFFFVRLVQDYSITAVCTNLKEKFQLKQHLIALAEDFNREIV